VSWVLVAVGGAIGAVGRYGVGVALARWSPAAALPWGTWAANLAGCFLIGLALPLLSTPDHPERTGLHLLLVTGVLGGFTTFSSYTAETLGLALEGRPGLALANAVLPVALGLAAAALGAWVGRSV
jgi:CrcB protein